MRPRSNAEASAASASSATWRTSRPITQGRHLRTHRKSGGGELKQRCEAKAATRPPAQRGEGLGRGASIASIADRLIPAEALGSEAHTLRAKGMHIARASCMPVVSGVCEVRCSRRVETRFDPPRLPFGRCCVGVGVFAEAACSALSAWSPQPCCPLRTASTRRTSRNTCCYHGAETDADGSGRAVHSASCPS